jgi:menaquinone-dependent protoporphyrinogen oxidase
VKVLVAAASKYGATMEIADAIAATLKEAGVDATAAKIDDVRDIAGYDAFVLGSGAYVGHWISEADDFVKRHAEELSKKPVWLFSSGPVGEPPLPGGDAVDTVHLREATSAREHRLFGGKLDRKRLNFAEKAMTLALRVPEGDFRNWDDIRAWAREIAAALSA